MASLRRLRPVHVALSLLCLCPWVRRAVCGEAGGAASAALAAEKEDARRLVDENFLAWFEEQGGRATGVTVGRFAGYGRGLLATQPLQDGDTVLQVPSSIIISRQLLISSARIPEAERDIYKRAQDETSALAMFLLKEGSLGDDSFWAPYLAVLPSSVPSSPFFSAEALSLLQDEWAQGVAASAKLRIEALYKQALPLLEKLLLLPVEAAAGADGGSGTSTSNSSSSSSNSSSGSHSSRSSRSSSSSTSSNSSSSSTIHGNSSSLEAFAWAVSIIDSRALRFRGVRQLVPLADMFNHANHPVQRVADSGSFFLRYHQEEKDGIRILADRVVQQGDQVFEDYGDNPNSIYLESHGFVPDPLGEANPFECVKLTLRQPPPPFSGQSVDDKGSSSSSSSGTLSEERDALLRLLQLPTVLELCLASSSVSTSTSTSASASTRAGQVALPGYAEQVMRVWSMDGAQLAKCSHSLQQRSQAQRQAGVSGVSRELCRPEASPALKAGVVTAAVQERLAAYSSWGTEEEEALLLELGQQQVEEQLVMQQQQQEEEEEQEHRRMAVTYRLLQKRVLHTILAALESHDAADVSPTAVGEEPSQEEAQEKVAAAAAVGDTAPTKVADTAGGARGEGQENGELDILVKQFNEWMEDQGCPSNRLAAAPVPGMRIGTFATEDIPAEELYLSVPTAVIMSAATARADKHMGPVLERLRRGLSSKGWNDDVDSLLLFLLHENFEKGEESAFWPYLALLPRLEDMNYPLLYASADVQLLKGSTVHSELVQYQTAVLSAFERKWDKGRALDNVLGKGFLTLERYLWGSAIVDSRSIWWGGGRHLVPMLDLVNCKEGPEGARVHSTTLSPSGDAAETRAPWAFKKGEQVFEDYGQPNSIYFLYHGFSLEGSKHDCVKVEGVMPTNADKDTRAALQKAFPRGRPSFCVSPGRLTADFVAYVRITSGLGMPLSEEDEADSGSTSALAALRDPPGVSALLEWTRQRLSAYPALKLSKGPDDLTAPEETILAFLKSERMLLHALEAMCVSQQQQNADIARRSSGSGTRSTIGEESTSNTTTNSSSSSSSSTLDQGSSTALSADTDARASLAEAGVGKAAAGARVGAPESASSDPAKAEL